MNNKGVITLVGMFAVYLVLAAVFGMGVYFAYSQQINKESFDRVVFVKDNKLILETINFANHEIIINEPVKFDFNIIDNKLVSGFESEEFNVNRLKSISVKDKEDYFEVRSK